MRALWQRLRASDRGAIITEFAAAMPVLVILLLAGVEVARYALLNQKLDRLANAMGDLVAQGETMTMAELNNIFSAAPFITWPFDVQVNGTVIITSVGMVGTTPTVNWQRKGVGPVTATSRIGGASGTATLPTGFTLGATDTAIIAEVFYNFTPMFTGSLVPGSQLYHESFYRPRLGALTSIN
jgi:Flp pilus assembly protein TadG